MKYQKNSVIAQLGVTAVERIVLGHGSIFRTVPNEVDIGVDAFIELVDDENATADLVAAQIKTGPSYLNSLRDGFRVSVDSRHLEYWSRLMMPVLMVCHWPEKDLTCFASIHDELERAAYQGERLASIDIPFNSELSVPIIDGPLKRLALRYRHQFELFERCDGAYVEEGDRQLEAIQTICHHPSLRYSRVAVVAAFNLLSSPNDNVVQSALHFLGYCCARKRWSWNPNNRSEREVSAFATDWCRRIDRDLFERLFELSWRGYWNGPESSLERLLDICIGCWDVVANALEEVAADERSDQKKRKCALWILFECDEQQIDEAVADGHPLAVELFSSE